MQIPATQRCIRFGSFAVDLASRELSKNGQKVTLQERPFKILSILLERPGELVTREELQGELWPAGTFVDFEHGINTAIKKLREALEDDAEHPRFIETLPKRGYRFIAEDEGDRQEKESASNRTAQARNTRLPRFWYLPVGGLLIMAGVLVLLPDLGGIRDRFFHTRSTLPLRIESLAVLPLDNLSQDPAQEYFADGLTDALITDLGKVGTLRLISRTSVLRYKRTNKSLPEIARELGVDAVIEGTVLRSGDKVRVTVQLIQAPTDKHLWAERYERDEAETLKLEKELALAIAHEVSGRITPAQEMQVGTGRSTNPRAYDAYLHGRYLWGQRTAEGENGARAYFEQALAEDPNFSLAYSGLADVYSVSWDIPNDESLAEKYARQAVALAPELAEGHASLGITLTYRRKFAEAERELRKAIQLNPNYAMAHHWYGLYFLELGRNTEALAENDRARQLDPFSLPINYIRTVMFIGLHEYDRALEQVQTGIAINPQVAGLHDEAARLYWLTDKIPQATAEMKIGATLMNDSLLLHDQDEIAAAYAKSGVRAAQLRAAQLAEKHHRDALAGTVPANLYADSWEVALRFALLKDTSKTLEFLEPAERKSKRFLDLASAPEVDFLRSDPRFRELRKQYGLPEN